MSVKFSLENNSPDYANPVMYQKNLKRRPNKHGRVTSEASRPSVNQV